MRGLAPAAGEQFYHKFAGSWTGSAMAIPDPRTDLICYMLLASRGWLPWGLNSYKPLGFCIDTTIFSFWCLQRWFLLWLLPFAESGESICFDLPLFSVAIDWLIFCVASKQVRWDESLIAITINLLSTQKRKKKRCCCCCYCGCWLGSQFRARISYDDTVSTCTGTTGYSPYMRARCT